MNERTDAGERQLLSSKFGVTTTIVNGQYEFAYTAGGEQHVVDRTSADPAGLSQAVFDLQKLTDEKLQSIEKQYQVTIAKQGEPVERAHITDTHTCDERPGEMIYALQPTLPQLYAVEQALKRSQPSQLSADGKQGVKIYFLDRQILPSVIPNSPKAVRGLYVPKDKDGRPAVYMTPDGANLPPTHADRGATPVKSLQWGLEHEIAHNSEKNQWGDIHKPPPSFAREIGWKVDLGRLPSGEIITLDQTFSGKDGRSYLFDGSNCKHPSWLLTDADGTVIDQSGKPIILDGKKSLESQEVRLSAEFVREQAKIPPISTYFVNPAEMTAEALAAFRGGAESRARLLEMSPPLYTAIKKYDEQELSRVYGVDAHGRSNFVRSPEGFLVRREADTEQTIHAFEQRHRKQ